MSSAKSKPFIGPKLVRDGMNRVTWKSQTMTMLLLMTAQIPLRTQRTNRQGGGTTQQPKETVG